MAFRKDNKNSVISINYYQFASPERFLERSHGEVLNRKQLTTELINQKEMVCFVKEFLVL